MKFLVAHQTDIGHRSSNQDSLCVKEAATRSGNVIMAVVCDGMGGLAKGEVASATIVCLFSRWFEQELEGILKESTSSTQVLTATRDSWNNIIQNTNQMISEYGKNNGGVKLGTTVTAMLIIEDGSYIIAHVGDTRAYRITNSSIDRITTDQTVVEQEVKAGRLTPEQAEKDKRRNVLLQCIGASGDLEPDFVTGRCNEGEVYLLCTDGFRHNITPQEFQTELAPKGIVAESDMQNKIEKLAAVNEKRGEKDNISSLLIKLI